MKRDSEGILQSQNGDNQPVKSRSSPLDSRGGISKEGQQARGAEKHPGYKHGEKTYDPRVQVGAGEGHPSKTELKAHPSHGGSIPSHKDPTEGTGSNYHKNTNQTRIPGDGAATVRTVMDKKQVRRNLANANNDVSSRKSN